MADIDEIFEGVENEKPAFNKEEWAKQQQENRAKAYEMLDNATQEISNPDIFMNYLSVQSRFDRYSVSNALLVAYQMPEATRLCDSKTWREHKVFIQKGERGILILEPGKEFKRQDGTVGVNYNAKKVFDVSQTTSKRKTVEPMKYNEKALVKALVKTSPVPVEISSDMYIDTSAIYRPDKKCILIRQGMPGDEIFRSLSKEIAHARLDKGDYSREKCELAASAISFIACEKVGIEPYRIESDKGLFDGMEPKDIRSELGTIRNEANSISLSIQKTMDARTKNADAR